MKLPPGSPVAGASELLDEADLLRRLRAGEERAFEQVVRRWGGRMLAAARRILGREEDAQDALQEAFLSAFRGLERFEGQARLGTWLQRIAINAALMKRRSASRRDERELDELLPGFTEHGHHAAAGGRWGEAASAGAEREESRALVRASIERLPETYRIALLLRDIEELDNEELAERLGVSVNAAKIRVHRARLALRALLDPHFGEPRK